jgi:hypothetical protein
MTQPKTTPVKLHFIAGIEYQGDAKSYHKRKYGWLPNKMKGRSYKTKRKK